MRINELIKETKWKHCGSDHNAEIKGIFVGDLLSYVMGHAEEKQIWITMQNHVNAIGVANLKEFSAIILIDSLEFDEECLKKAKASHVAVISSPLNAVDTLRKLIELGL